MTFKSENGMKTNYEIFGDNKNPAMLLLHGLGAELSSWSEQIDLYPEAGFFVVVPDLYGHGESSKMDTLELDHWNKQINDLLDYLEIQTCIIIGVSMGGVVAQYYTVKNLQRVNILIISDSFAELKSIKEKLLGFSQIVGFKIYKVLGRKLFAKGMAAAYKPSFAEKARKYMYEKSLVADFNQLLFARKVINKIDIVQDLGQVKIPSLIIVGNQFGPMFVGINKKIADAIEGSKFVVLDNSMDPSPLVNPKDFNNEVLSFLVNYE
ncbi:MAG: alpha/beta hydrolase [Spirochaetales bacterium]|nr:alpha/beta hydrolase [Spirochaetales bacterium]